MTYLLFLSALFAGNSLHCSGFETPPFRPSLVTEPMPSAPLQPIRIRFALPPSPYTCSFSREGRLLLRDADLRAVPFLGDAPPQTTVYEIDCIRQEEGGFNTLQTIIHHQVSANAKGVCA